MDIQYAATAIKAWTDHGASLATRKPHSASVILKNGASCNPRVVYQLEPGANPAWSVDVTVPANTSAEVRVLV